MKMFLNSGRTYPKAMATFRVKQQSVRTTKIAVFPVVRIQFLKKLVSPVAIILAVMLGLNLLMGSMISSTSAKRAAVASVRHDLVDKNIALRAERIGLMSDKAIYTMAGKRLSLVQPEGRRYTFSR